MSRFWDKVNKAGQTGCWKWTGSRDRQGYGQFRLDGKSQLAHRVAYLLEVDEIPEGMCVCHTCDNPSCVNPKHLWLGTNADNQADMYAKGRGTKPVGEAHYKTTLTADDVENIRANSMNLNGVELAKLFGVSKSTISGILKRKTWRHI